MPFDPDTGIWESDYTPPSPRELPAIRTYLHDTLRTRTTLAFHTTMAAQGRYAILPHRDPVTAATILLDDERHRLAHASLYWVSPEMTRVAKAASTTLPEDLRVDQTHQPAEHGFLIFGEPIGTYLGDQFHTRRIPITATSWGPAPYLGVDGKPSTWVTFYSHRDEDYLRHILPLVLHKPRSNDLAAAVRATPEWMWDNEIALSHDRTIGHLNRAHDRTTDQSVIPWLKVLYSAWLLMTQPGITEVTAHTPTRQQRRQDRRHGMRSSDVQLVDVHTHHHAPTGATDTDTGDREYTCRWLVRGHWRNQPCGPNRTQRRPVWINPHVKGPDNKPMKTGDVVNVWHR